MDIKLKEKILKIVNNVFNVNLAQINPDMDLRDQFCIDSMQFITLSSRIEQELEIELPISIIETRSLNEFFKKIESELKKSQNKNH